MITKEQAITENVFHTVECKAWRRNGSTQTWKTRPNEYRVPVKFGLYAYGQIWHHDAGYVHIPGAPGCKEARQ